MAQFGEGFGAAYCMTAEDQRRPSDILLSDVFMELSNVGSVRKSTSCLYKAKR